MLTSSTDASRESNALNPGVVGIGMLRIYVFQK